MDNEKRLVIERLARALYDNELGCPHLECEGSCTDDLVASLESAWQAIIREFPALKEMDIGDILDDITVLMWHDPRLIQEIPCEEYLH